MPWSRHHSPYPTTVSPSPCIRFLLCVCCAFLAAVRKKQQWQTFPNPEGFSAQRKLMRFVQSLHSIFGNDYYCNIRYETWYWMRYGKWLTNLFQVNRDSTRRNRFFEQNRRVCSALVCWGMSTETKQGRTPDLAMFFEFLAILSFRVAFEKLVYDLSRFDKVYIDILGCTNRNSWCPRLLSQSQPMSSLLLVACSTLNYNSFQLNEH